MEPIVPAVLQVRKLAQGREGQRQHDSGIFPASLPASKPRHDRRMWQMPFIISIHEHPHWSLQTVPPCPARPAAHQPCPPLGWRPLIFIPLHPSVQPLPVFPTHPAGLYHSGSCSNVTSRSQLKFQAMPTPLSTSPPYDSLQFLSLFPLEWASLSEAFVRTFCFLGPVSLLTHLASLTFKPFSFAILKDQTST